MLVSLFAANLWAAANPWRDNLTRADVVAALGPPKSTVQVGAREMMTYDGGVMIELQGGKVSNISGHIPDALKPGGGTAPATSVATTPAVASTPVVTPVSAAPATPPPAAPVAAPAASTAPKPAVANVPAPAASGKVTAADTGAGVGDDELVKEAGDPTSSPEAKAAIAKLTGGQMEVNSSGLPTMPSKPAVPEPPASMTQILIRFAAGWGISTVFMMGVLKLAFMKKDFPIIWRDIFMVSVLTALFYQTLNTLLAGNEFFALAHMLQADQILAGVLMLVLIQKFTEVKQFHTAAGITLAAMIVNTALYFGLQIFVSF